MSHPSPQRFAERYESLADRDLAAMLAAEDVEEESGGLHALDRITCAVHRRWAHECIASPLHIIAVTGHRWCRTCQTMAMVSVDHLAGVVKVLCPRCWRAPASPATAQIIRTCEASLHAARRHSTPQRTRPSREADELRPPSWPAKTADRQPVAAA